MNWYKVAKIVELIQNSCYRFRNKSQYASFSVQDFQQCYIRTQAADLGIKLLLWVTDSLAEIHVFKSCCRFYLCLVILCRVNRSRKLFSPTIRFCNCPYRALNLVNQSLYIATQGIPSRTNHNIKLTSESLDVVLRSKCVSIFVISTDANESL